MFYINKNEELTNERLLAFLMAFQTNQRPQLVKWGNYYNGKQEILSKPRIDCKPCNKIVSNFCKTIVDNYVGYLCGKDVTYTDETGAISDVLQSNDVSLKDSELLQKALIYGRGYEVCYLDDNKEIKFKCLESVDTFGVYSNDLDKKLMYIVNFYQIDSLDAGKGFNVAVYDKKNTYYFHANQGLSSLKLVDEQVNYFGDVPVAIMSTGDNKALFDGIMSLQDGYNTLLSGEIDDFEAFCDAYLVLTGCTLDTEDIKEMRENRVMVLDEGAVASYLTKNISDTQIENILENIQKNIHKMANCPDFSEEGFGTSSGIAMRYKLLGFENSAGAIEKLLSLAIYERITLIASILGVKGVSVDVNAIGVMFTRNLPVDEQGQASMVNTLRGLVSDKTLLALLPFISDTEAELALLQEQKETAATLYSFGTDGTEE